MTLEREQESLVSRRSLLIAASGTIAGTVIATIPAAAALADTELDTELLRLDREHDEVYVRSLRVDSGPDGLDNDDIEEISDALWDVEHAIHRIPAQTLAGLAVKARLASVYFDPNPADPLEMGILTSLVEDILRMADVTGKHPVALPYKTWEA